MCTAAWLRRFVVALSALGIGAAAQATTVLVDFDSIASGATANSAVTGLGFRFDLASYLPALDGFGDPIPGSEAYRPDPSPVDDARVNDPSTRGYGTAPSPLNALDALDQGVLITFDTPTDLASFAATLDVSVLGFPGTFDIVFQDTAGGVLHLLPTAQSVPGFLAALSGPLLDVASIYLPSGAYYDNLTIASVPEPGLAWLLGISAAGLLSWRRR